MGLNLSRWKISKFVYAASSSCYGKASTPTSENHLINPLYPYALSKYQGEQLSFHWNKVYRLPVNSIRIFNAYGLRVKTTGVYGAAFGVFLKQKLKNKPFTVVGNGNQKRDFIYVEDAIQAMVLAGTKRDKFVSGVYNIGTGHATSLRQMIRNIKAAGVEVKVAYTPKARVRQNSFSLDASRFRKCFGWKPKVLPSVGIKNTLLWFQKKATL